jgi:CheY-like chemotaxis protein
MEFEQMPFDLAASLEAVAGLYEQTARAKNLTFQVKTDESARGVYLGDPTRLRQVLQNLVSNAMKFTKAGSVRVNVTAEPAPGGRRAVRFEVVDTGVGVSAEAQGRLFAKFMQADSSTSRKFGGTGLGLAICRELVTAMGGEIGVDSEEGQGACFWFTLPLMLAAEIEPEVEEVVEEMEDRPLRILAAEDNATNQFVLKAILGQKGLEATFVENGRLAVEAVQCERLRPDPHGPAHARDGRPDGHPGDPRAGRAQGGCARRGGDRRGHARADPPMPRGRHGRPRGQTHPARRALRHDRGSAHAQRVAAADGLKRGQG